MHENYRNDLDYTWNYTSGIVPTKNSIPDFREFLGIFTKSMKNSQKQIQLRIDGNLLQRESLMMGRMLREIKIAGTG